MATQRPQHASDQLQLLLTMLDEAFSKRAWHGPNLRGSLRGVSAKQASFRPASGPGPGPGPGRHCIWEIAVHAAYWKYAVRRRLTGEKRGSFALEGSNWFPRPPKLSGAALEQAWRDDLKLLDREHRALRDAVAALPPARLAADASGAKGSFARLIWSIAMHDVYHAGQVQHLKRSAGSR
jgi:hypothetical protein